MPSWPARRATAHAALVLLALILLALVWHYLAPAYDRALVVLASPLVSSEVALQAEGLEITLRYLPLEVRNSPSIWVHGMIFHAGLLLMTALILATPACSWRRRGVGLAAVWPGLLAVHVGSVALLGWGLAWSEGNGPLALARLAPIMPLAYLGLPALAGAAWCLKFWFPVLISSASPQSRIHQKDVHQAPSGFSCWLR